MAEEISYDKTEIRNITIVAYTKKEAEDLAKWCCSNIKAFRQPSYNKTMKYISIERITLKEYNTAAKELYYKRVLAVKAKYLKEGANNE